MPIRISIGMLEEGRPAWPWHPHREAVMKKTAIMAMMFPCLLAALCACGRSVSISEIWATPGELRVPESVLHDAIRNVLYVSNIDGVPTGKDGDGFISRISMEGKILDFKWISGMDAPKGMALRGNTLYVADIDRLHVMDALEGKIRESFKADGAKFLNDIAVDDDGAVYVSDMQANRIYIMRKRSISVWLEFKDFTGINGMIFSDGSIYAGSEQGVLKINPADGKYELFIPLTGGIDGLKAFDCGRFVVTDWKGKIQVIEQEKKPQLLQDTTGRKINAADIEYIAEEKTLLVPTFFDNRVVAYRLD